jgi:hypothetical protein
LSLFDLCPLNLLLLQYLLKGYAPLAAAGRAHQQSSWQWICCECLPSIEFSILGCEVKIYWEDDQKFYEGTVAALDSKASREHRIQYKDEEWGFVDISAEDYFLRLGAQRLKQFRALVQSPSPAKVAKKPLPITDPVLEEGECEEGEESER